MVSSASPAHQRVDDEQHLTLLDKNGLVLARDTEARAARFFNKQGFADIALGMSPPELPPPRFLNSLMPSCPFLFIDQLKGRWASRQDHRYRHRAADDADPASGSCRTLRPGRSAGLPSSLQVTRRHAASIPSCAAINSACPWRLTSSEDPRCRTPRSLAWQAISS